MQYSTKVCVVGTTADYIDWIRGSCPGRALFLTDPMVRQQAQEPRPTPAEEILCDLSDYVQVRQALQQHLRHEGLRLDGIASYDCESMELAAVVAQEYALPYPSVQAVNNCRSKYLSRLLWHSHGLRTPRVRLIRSTAEAVCFFRELGGPCVVKPVSGSGSELVFRCDSEQACETSFETIQNGLKQRRANRLYKPLTDEEPMILAEAFLEGEEFSCDFVIENGRVGIIRIARKILSSQGPFGTALGYLLSDALPDEVEEHDLLQTLYQGATALGLNRAICMLDFLILENRIVLLELAPRPGGDCLPFLLRRCWNLDPLTLFLNFCQQQPVCLEKPAHTHSCLGLRLHARQGGILKSVDVSRLRQDPRVREIHVIRNPGHLIRMPPDDYDSWLLGHIIVEPVTDVELESECQSFIEKVLVEIV
ncbi:MAG: ATP-grasp domain-containing protein [Candidatus Hodarchaeota archaeon]